ncbi:hypothetical protein GBQ70_05190 [Halomicrobium sp. ZPS1]|uniref:Uncharacterized protein n=1 Tax=Halomicrobium mukohataei TaxID=57705 RepID=A0A4D6KGQ8_9EURY|nr:hypothetical protein E5139_05195 [Halomicrobium mukohataei]QFR19869.1 hypothetical protein GBQ70_05190 [Halomicrobium sp. ZPS1]
MLILLSGSCGVDEDKDTAAAVPDWNDSLDVFGSESVAPDLLQQVRWRNSVICLRCRSDGTLSNALFEPHREINNVLRISVYI